MYCAANKDRLSKVQEIADAYNLPSPFLFKLCQPLIKNGFIVSVRGSTGGLKLGKPASEIKLSAVIRITEDSFEMAECFKDEGTDCPLVDSCGLNSVLREALNAFFDVMEKYSIADLTANRHGIERLLGIDLINKSLQ